MRFHRSHKPPSQSDVGTRRDVLKSAGLAVSGMHVGALSLATGMTHSGLLRAAEARNKRPSGPAKSVILFNLLGGPSQLDMFDMKPSAPTEIRGEFAPIQTSLPGLHICEHMPRIAEEGATVALVHGHLSLGDAARHPGHRDK